MGICYRLLLVSLLLQPCLSWSHGTTVDLAWPPLAAESYGTINSVEQPTYNNDFFPCSNQPIDSSTPRVVFPVTGGRLQFNLTNTTDLITYKYIGSIYIGQFSGDTAPARNASEYITTYAWKDFRTSPDCGETVNLTRYVNEAFEMVAGEEDTNINERDIIGMNATIAIRNVLFSTDSYYDYPGDIYNVEEMYQCGYITIGPPGISIQAGDFCNSEEGLAYIASISSFGVAATATPTSGRPSNPSSTSDSILTRTRSASTSPSATTAQPTTTSSVTSPSENNNTSHNKSLIIGVSVSVGISLILLIIGIVLFRRRKQRKGTMGPDTIVTRQEGLGKSEKQNGEKKMEREEDAVEDILTKEGNDGEGKIESSGNSVKSEVLPVYEK
ncbi:hypothetical protein VTL71DRAFT_11203 [Oculimacula yallundae]|uniref:Uncharacterized protein n=1 Tax=Oculimacula yallundae TaxID=86028 RepID=A0ABR4CWB5_9HELO